MTIAAELIDGIETVDADLADARSHTIQARACAEELTASATAHGWTGVAATVAAAEDAVEAVIAGLDTATRNLAAATATLRGVGDQPDSREVADLLAAVVTALGHARDGIDAATEAADQARQAAQRAGEPRRLMLLLQAGADGLDKARHGIAGIQDRSEGEARHAANWAAHTGAGGAPLTGRATPPEPRLDDLLTAPGQLVGWVRDAADRLPHRPGGKGPTHGRLFDPAGRPLTDPAFTQADGQLRSGKVANARHRLRPDWRPGAQVIDEHVEAHAAALLCKPVTPDEAVIVVNKSTCVRWGNYIGCDDVLDGILPRGKRLAVYVREGGQPKLWKVYRGTGEGTTP